MAKRYFASCKTTPLEPGIETIFLSLVRQTSPRFTNVMDCLVNKVNRVPSEKVLSTVIFEILMNEDCDKKTAIEASNYLSDTLTIHPPSDFSRRCYYKDALTGGRAFGFTNLWSVFEHIVNSSFIHYKILEIEEKQERKPIPHPNCDILVDFYVRVLNDSCDFLSSEKNLYGERSLVMDLFWATKPYCSIADKKPVQLLEWINNIYFHSARLSKISAFLSLHKLLNLMMQCIMMHSEYNLNERVTSTIIADNLICISSCIVDVVRAIFKYCKEAFSSSENFRRFLLNLSSKAVQFKVCEYAMNELINSSQPSARKFSPCTLQSLVTVYMFPIKVSSGKRGRPKKSLEDKDEKKEKAEAISKTNDENSKHKLNFNVVDNEGQTTLHTAIKENKVRIAKYILIHGGSKLLEIKDKYGRKPLQYASKEMKQILREVDINTDKPSISIKTITDLDVRTFQNFKEYAFYCHILHSLITNYAHVYNIYHLRKLIIENSSQVDVLKHEDKNCPHFRSCQENAVCSEDIDCIKILPDIVSHFINRTAECAKGRQLNLELELLPLKVFSAVLG